MVDDALIADVAALLPDEDRSRLALVPCGAGGNNRVFTLHAGGRTVVAKWYFTHPSDSRDRLAAEQAFLRYAASAGIACVPKLIAADPARRLALYEQIVGKPVAAHEVTAVEVTAAADFFLALNQPACRPLATELPEASEACFSVQDHLALVDRRLDRLATIGTESAEDRDAHRFSIELKARWHSLKDALRRDASTLGIDVAAELPASERCISPSDFGFHNVLRRPSGALCFLDFEYAGWDDPAKMAGDFFSHPAIAVEPRFRPLFLERAFGFSAEPERLRQRAELLLPVFQVKWCCIILNEFLTDSARRRHFADPGFDVAQRKQQQLAKARRLFAIIGHR